MQQQLDQLIIITRKYCLGIYMIKYINFFAQLESKVF